jgi:hypothetical protein
MDSPYLFHDNSMVFHAPVQRRPAAPQGHGGRAQPQPHRPAPPHREDQLLSRRALIGYASPRQDDERSYSPLPALPTVLRARNHLRPTPDQGQLSPLVAPPPAPAFLAPSYRPVTLARTTSASTKNSLGFILDGSRAQRDPFSPHEDRNGYRHEDTHSFRREDTHRFHRDGIHGVPRMRDERSFKEEEYPPLAASRFGTGGSQFPPPREDARGRLVSDDSADSSSYTSSPMPVTTAWRSSSASVRPLDMPSAPAATERTKKKRKARICTTEGCTKYVVDHGLCIRHGVRFPFPCFFHGTGSGLTHVVVGVTKNLFYCILMRKKNLPW